MDAEAKPRTTDLRLVKVRVEEHCAVGDREEPAGRNDRVRPPGRLQNAECKGHQSGEAQHQRNEFVQLGDVKRHVASAPTADPPCPMPTSKPACPMHAAAIPTGRNRVSIDSKGLHATADCTMLRTADALFTNQPSLRSGPGSITAPRRNCRTTI